MSRRSPLKELGGGLHGDVIIEREHRPSAPGVAEAVKIGAGGAGRIDHQAQGTPIIEHVLLGVRRLGHYQVEMPRVLAVGQKQGPVV